MKRADNSDLGILVRVVSIYVVFSALWIVLSDKVVAYIAGDFERLSMYQTVKGLAFIATSALVLFLLLRRELSARKRAELQADLVSKRQKRVQEDLRGSEARYRTLAEHSLDGLLITGPDGRIHAANPAACRIFGRTEDELREAGRAGVLDSEDAGVEALLKEWEKTGKAFGVLTMLRGDGSKFEGEVSSSIFETPEGARTSMIIRDITERKEVEEELRRSENRYRSLFQSARDAIFILRDGCFVDCNAAAEKMFRGTKGEIVNRRPDELSPEGQPDGSNSLDASREWMQRSLDGENQFFEWVHRRLDGTPFDAEVSLNRFWENDGFSILAIVRDITDRREAEQEIRRQREHLEEEVSDRTQELAAAKERAESADRLKSAFLATMSHELRTPLNSVIGFTGILLQEIPGELNEEQRKQLKIVQASAKHLFSLINDVLDISKIEAGQLDVERERFHLGEAAQIVACSMRRFAEEKGFVLDVKIDSDVGVIIGDRRRYEQVLINLLSNAVKFTETGNVSVDVYRKDGGFVETVVRDTGIGVKCEDQEVIFKPFHQLENGIARKHEGTGLGLSICRRLTALMGGEIWVTSEFGDGSVFGFTLPENPETKETKSDRIEENKLGSLTRNMNSRKGEGEKRV